MASFRCAIKASLLVRSACALAASARASAASARASAASARASVSSACAAIRAARSATIIAWALARSAGSDSKAAVTTRWNHIHPCRQAGSSSDRGWTPSCLGMTPVDARQKIAELGRRDRHRAVGCARPQKAAPFEPLREQARALAVVPDNLQQVAAAAAKAEQVATQRILPQHLLNLQRQAGEPFAQIRVPGRQPHPNARRDRDHRRSRTSRTRAKAAASTPALTITRRPRPSTISIRSSPDVAQPNPVFDVTPVGGSGTITAGTKPGTGPASDRSGRSVRRQARSWEREMPCRLAVSETSRGPARLSKTILAFSSSDQRPRRPVSTISSRPKALRVRLSIRTVLSATNTAPQGGPHRKLTEHQLRPDPPAHSLLEVPTGLGGDNGGGQAAGHLGAATPSW